MTAATPGQAPPGRYRKKPAVVEAVRWDGTVRGATAIIDWVLAGGGTARYRDDEPHHCIAVNTLDGSMHALPGYWVIKDAEGEFCPCKPDIFEATYEAAAQEPHAAPELAAAMAETRRCREALNALAGRVTALAADLAASATATRPSRKSQTEDECAIALRRLTEGL